MRAILRKDSSMWILAIVPFFLVSIAKFDSNTKDNYWNASEIVNHDFNNTLRFTTGTEVISNGAKFSVLKLHIEDDNIALEHSMEIVISKEKGLGRIGPGKYRIAKDEDGLLNYVDGVFGFLDSKNHGELPFFAHVGEITITQLDDEVVNGSMDIFFKNNTGNSIQMKGDFVALP